MSLKAYNFVKADLARFGLYPSLGRVCKELIGNNRSFKYTFWLRMGRSEMAIVRWISKIMHRFMSDKYQIQIPIETEIGPGLYLGHATSIVVSRSAIIGKNCNLSQFVNIGTNFGKAATIGDNVYIGPSVCIVENVSVGDNVTIGAGSVVVNNILKDSTAVGNPAKVVNKLNPAQFIRNPV